MCKEGPYLQFPSYRNKVLPSTYFLMISYEVNLLNVNFAECTNNFVQVVYTETIAGSTISCIFLNQSDVSEKSCYITFQLCGHLFQTDFQVTGCNEHRIHFDVSNSVSSGQRYCYTAIAGNATYTVKMDGAFITGITIITVLL